MENLVAEAEELLSEIRADFGGGFHGEHDDEFGFGSVGGLNLADAKSALAELAAEPGDDLFGESAGTLFGEPPGFADLEFADAEAALADIESELSLGGANQGSLEGLLRANPGLKITISY